MSTDKSFFGHSKRTFAIILSDIILSVICAYAAMLAKFAPEIQPGDVAAVTRYLPLLVLSYIFVFAVFRIYKTLWRYADAFQFAKQGMAAIIALGITLIANGLVSRFMNEQPLSNNFLIIHFFFTLTGVSAFRLCMKLARQNRSDENVEPALNPRRILVVGAGEAGSHLVRMVASAGAAQGEICAIADDDPVKQGLLICDIPVCGTIADIPRLASEKGVTDIIIALPTASRERLDEIAASCLSTGCFVRVMDKLKRLTDSDASSPEADAAE